MATSGGALESKQGSRICTQGRKFKDGHLRVIRKRGKQGVVGDSPHVLGGGDLGRSTAWGAPRVKGT